MKTTVVGLVAALFWLSGSISSTPAEPAEAPYCRRPTEDALATLMLQVRELRREVIQLRLERNQERIDRISGQLHRITAERERIEHIKSETQHGLTALDVELANRSISQEQRDHLLATRLSLLTSDAVSEETSVMQKQQQLERELAILRDQQTRLDIVLRQQE